MTREEAIEALTSKDVHNSDIMLEALDMAISALEAQELSNNSPKLDSGNGELTDGDLVSRKDVIDEIDEWIKDCTDSNHYQSASDLRLVRKCIEGL